MCPRGGFHRAAAAVAAGGVLTLALVDSGEQQPILVGARDSDDDDDEFEGDYEGASGPRELEMTNNPKISSVRSGITATSGGRTLAAKIGRRMAANGSSNGNGNGGIESANGEAVEVGGAHLSPGPSQGRSPINPKKKGAGMGMYARVGGGDVEGGGEGRQYGIMFEESSARHHRQASDGGDGFSEDEEYQTLRLGRTAEVEGQMEAGRGGSRWDDAGSDSSSGDDHAGASDLVQPA